MSELPILKKLREVQTLMHHPDGSWTGTLANRDGDEAADLIEKLTEALETLDEATAAYDDMGPYGEEWTSERLENARRDARAALELAKKA
jgi:hypothetical protein